MMNKYYLNLNLAYLNVNPPVYCISECPQPINGIGLVYGQVSSVKMMLRYSLADYMHPITITITCSAGFLIR